MRSKGKRVVRDFMNDRDRECLIMREEKQKRKDEEEERRKTDVLDHGKTRS